MQASSLERSSCKDVSPQASVRTMLSVRKGVGPGGWGMKTRLYGVWLVMQYIWVLYAYVSSCTKVSQSFRFAAP